RVLLAKRGQDLWVEAPLQDRADRERSDDLMSALTTLEAVSFVDELPAGGAAALGLDPPQATVEVIVKGRKDPLRIAIGAPTGPAPEAAAPPAALAAEEPPPPPPAPPRYARVDGQLATVAMGPLVEAAMRPAGDWRSRAWTSLAVYEIDRVELREGAGGKPP